MIVCLGKETEGERWWLGVGQRRWLWVSVNVVYHQAEDVGYGVYDMPATNSHGGQAAKKPIPVAVSFCFNYSPVCETSRPSDKSSDPRPGLEGQWPLGKPCHFAGCKTARANATSRLVTRGLRADSLRRGVT